MAPTARERFRRLFVRLLDLLVDAAVAAGDREEAVRLLERTVEAEPLDDAR